MLKLRRRVFEIVNPAAPGDVQSMLFDALIIVLILVDITALVAATEWHFGNQVLAVVGPAIPTVFLVEYVLRLWACKEDERYAGSRGRLRYAMTPMAVIDLIATVPVLSFFGLGVPPALAAVRVFRLLKLVRYFETVQVLGRSLLRVRAQLTALFAALIMIVLVASLLIFAFESDENPQFSSIPDGMWWAIVTMTTVGYGDMVPQSPEGRVLASLLGICGIGMFAIPAGLLGATFSEEVTIQLERRRRRREKREHRATQELKDKLEAVLETEECPHCGKPLHGLAPGGDT